MLNDSTVHIWYRRTDSLTADEIQSTGQHLSTEEYSRRDRLVFPEDRRDFAVAHDLLRRVLSKYHPCLPSDWIFTTNSFGKPSAHPGTTWSNLKVTKSMQSPLSFSLSHTRSFVACAVATKGSIGIDVEQLNEKIDCMALAQQYYSPGEAIELSRCEDNLRSNRFTELWTLKEAFLKARGVGLSGGLDSIVFPFREDHTIDLTAFQTIDRADWQFAMYAPLDTVRLSVAVCGIDATNFQVFREA